MVSNGGISRLNWITVKLRREALNHERIANGRIVRIPSRSSTVLTSILSLALFKQAET